MIFYSKLLIIILKLNALSLNKCELYMNMSYRVNKRSRRQAGQNTTQTQQKPNRTQQTQHDIIITIKF